MKQLTLAKAICIGAAMILIEVPGVQASQLLVSSGVFNSGTGQFYDVATFTPADPFATSIEHSRSDTFDLSDPSTGFLTGGFSGTSIAQYGQLKTDIGGSVAGSDTFPSITLYTSAFFFDTMTFTPPSDQSGTAYFNITLDGSGTVTNGSGIPVSESPGMGVYGSSYATLLAGVPGTATFSHIVDVSNQSANTTVLREICGQRNFDIDGDAIYEWNRIAGLGAAQAQPYVMIGWAWRRRI